jgi:GT2 family glycosyltransferase
MKLAVVIVNYNVKHFLEQCLHSVSKAMKGIDAEVWVVDNHSVDGSVDMLKEKFPFVIIIENKKNVGFSVANNQAIKQADAEYILLLNPDTVVEEETFRKTIKFMDAHPQAGALGVKMLDGKGHFLPESKRALPTPEVAFYKVFGLAYLFPRSTRYGKYHLTYLDENKINEVDVLSGAFMLIRKAVLAKTGLLDETFFMYGEDIDLSYRLTQAGYKNYYFPETRIIHYKGESTRKSSVNYVLVFYKAMKIFAEKHFSHKNARLFSSFINAAIFFRASVAIIHRMASKLLYPIIDFIIIYAGYYFISLLYAEKKFSSSAYYSHLFLLFILPAYIIIWLSCIMLSGGYDRPVKQWNTIRGILLGTALILILYALLPEEYRFSRALILIGSLWAIVALTIIRQILVTFKVKGFAARSRRILIIGEPEECERVLSLLKKTGITIEEVKLATNPAVLRETNGKEDSFEAWNEILDVYNLNELIFCAKNLSSQLIMDAMSSITGKDVEFKIAPQESWAVIGSNSINAPGELYVIDFHAINTAPNIRNKRVLDIVLSLVLLVLSPVFCWIQKSPAGFFKNALFVLIGKKSYIGYYKKPGMNLHRLPPVKPGVLTPLDALAIIPDDATIHDLNTIYARDYRILTDLKIIFKGIRNLGRNE